MGSFSNFWENEILDHLFMKGAYTPPTNIHVALSTADPTEDGSGIAEPVGGSYARVSTAGADWTAAVAGALSNANTIQFPAATAGWGTITHFALFDSGAGGNFLAYGSVGSKVVNIGDEPRFLAGELDVSLN